MASPDRPRNFNQGSPLLEVRQLRRRRGRHQVLSIDHLHLEAGETLLLLGRNGAGKSTLMRILAGLEHADSGELRWQGRIIERGSRKALRGQVIYLHQTPYLFDTSVGDNIDYGLRVQGIAAAERACRRDQALAWSGLEHLAGRAASQLSGGERQRVALARAWVLRPAALLLDEPTANMDRDARHQTHFLIRRLAAEGIAILLTGHGLQDDHPMLSRTLILDQGQLHRPSPASSAAQPENQDLDSQPGQRQRGHA